MAEPTYTKQEQVSATTEITEVAPNILRTQLPINLPGLGHVNMYVLEDSRGVAVVDPGLPGKATWTAINQRLREIGVPIRRVHSIIVTHSHPDHFGGAGRLRAATGAEIITHKSFRLFYDPTEPDDVDVETVAAHHTPFGATPWGGPGHSLPWKRKLYYKGIRRMPTLFRAPKPTMRLAEGEHISLAGREWMAIHTPGHTEDHLCLFDPEAGVMLCGDHVLPTITPHISGMSSQPDPLNGFFESLDKVGAFGSQVKVSLPAHGKPFTNLAQRCEEIKTHHIGRLDKLRTTAAEFDKPATVTEFSGHLFSPRAQGTMADSETFAHLEHLRIAGEFDYRVVDGVREYVQVQ